MISRKIHQDSANDQLFRMAFQHSFPLLSMIPGLGCSEVVICSKALSSAPRDLTADRHPPVAHRPAKAAARQLGNDC